MRCELAVIDHNFHVNREHMVDEDGNNSMVICRSRRTKNWVAYARLRDKKYIYIYGR